MPSYVKKILDLVEPSHLEEVKTRLIWQQNTLNAENILHSIRQLNGRIKQHQQVADSIFQKVTKQEKELRRLMERKGTKSRRMDSQKDGLAKLNKELASIIKKLSQNKNDRIHCKQVFDLIFEIILQDLHNQKNNIASTKSLDVITLSDK